MDNAVGVRHWGGVADRSWTRWHEKADPMSPPNADSSKPIPKTKVIQRKAPSRGNRASRETWLESDVHQGANRLIRRRELTTSC